MMPLIGWVVGVSIVDLIANFDHWIAFGPLTYIVLRMIYEGVEIDSKKMVGSSSISVLLMLPIVTSIDALAVGLSLSFLGVAILVLAAIIGIITFSLSFVGLYIGKRFGGFVEKIGVLGGIVLIGIDIEILIDHMGILI